MISWGHDEYLYLVMKEQSSLPKEALSMIRYHSFYPWHRGGAYEQFMVEDDYEQLKAVKAFNRESLRYLIDVPVTDLEQPMTCTPSPTSRHRSKSSSHTTRA
jgi:inositol oxygenase